MIDSPYQRIFDKGVAQFKSKQYEGAIQSFTDATSLKPERFAPYLNRGTIYLQLSLLSQALSDFNRSVELDPRDPTGYFNRAIVRLKENRPAQALSDLYITLSCLYLQRGESAREIKFLTKSISFVENNVYAYLERGKLYKIKGNNMMAVNDFSGAIELDAQNMEAYALRGSLYRDMKQEENAISDTGIVMVLSKEGRKKPIELKPELKQMNDAQLNQEIVTRLKEIAEMRNTLASLKVEFGDRSVGERSERLIQERSEKTINERNIEKSERTDKSVAGSPAPTPLPTPLATPLPSKEFVDIIDIPAPSYEQIPVSPPADLIVEPETITVDVQEQIHLKTMAKQQSESEQELLTEQPILHLEPIPLKNFGVQKQQISHDSKVDDSAEIDDKIERIQTEIEQDRKVMIGDGNGSSVYDSKIEENLLELSNPLQKSSEVKENREDKAKSSIISDDSVKNSVEVPANKKAQEGAGHQEYGIGTEEGLDTKKSVERPKTTLEIEIVAGSLTHNTEMFGKMSPYCIVTYNGEDKHTSVKEDGGKNPVWNDKLYFPISHKSDEIRISVWDKETIKNDDLVGQGVLSLMSGSSKCNLLFEGKAAGIIYVKIRSL